jgi:hypothetical protein
MNLFGRNYGYKPGPNYGRAHQVTGLCDISPINFYDGEGRVVLLYKYLQKLTGHPVQPRDQGSSPTCVGQSIAGGVDRLQALAAVAFGVKMQYIPADANSIYALARHEIGFKRHGRKPGGDGTQVRYAAEAVRDLGCLSMGKHSEYDLTVFDDRLYKQWGKTGLPDHLEPIAKLAAIRKYIPVRSYEEARAAIVNGMPVIIGSSYGFKGGVRDADGFMKPRGTWRHAMLWDGVDDAHSRPGVHNQNSWGNTPAGPTRHGQPEGGFWIDADVVDTMCKKGEAIALAGFNGFAPTPVSLNYKLI